ncbi:MAG: phasin family protein [Pseudomonadota bacterium]|uniref:phasin family protein n=1 Tax=Fodinicurvata fenggangensis TaxID=1121830 RepID=UPI000552A735|nr:phasin family protein [Fodinicurvata fenggangensis]
MAKSDKTYSNPFLDTDFQKMMDFSRMAENWQVPGFDPQQVLEAQRKNIEAITNANRVAYEGAQAMAQRQAEIFQTTMEEASKVMNDMAASGAPEERMAKQAELCRQAFEKAIANMRELAEMGAKSNSEAQDLINQRVSESIEEVRGTIQKMSEEAKTQRGEQKK